LSPKFNKLFIRLSLFVENVADSVIENEHKVNTMEIEIDRELSSIIARRQPTANDLRLLMAISKATANLERVGDEAAKIARMVKSMLVHGSFRALPSSESEAATEMASNLLRKSSGRICKIGYCYSGLHFERR
jgi:phosphate transport system protein